MSRPLSPRGVVLFAFGVALALYFAWLLRDVLVVIYVSALFAVVLMPLVRWVMKLRIGRWHPGRGMAVLLILIFVVGCLTCFFIFGLAPAFRDLRDFMGQLPERGPQFFGRLQRLPLIRNVDLVSLQEKVESVAGHSATYVLRFASDWAGALARVIAGMVLTVYFILEGDVAYLWFLSLFPPARRVRLNQTLETAAMRMGRWLLGQGSLMVILGVTSTIVFVALHIRYAYALGVIMGLFNIVPVVGAMASVTLVLIVAGLDSWGRVIGVLIFYFVYVQIENAWLTPRIMRTQVNLAGLTILIALLIGAALAGVIGALVAVPTAVLIAVMLNEYAIHEDTLVEPPGVETTTR
ncbi:MAG: AI-2E family transporter [Acidobacteriaceae bacterium]